MKRKNNVLVNTKRKQSNRKICQKTAYTLNEILHKWLMKSESLSILGTSGKFADKCSREDNVPG